MTTKPAALFCLLALPFGATAISAPCYAQTKPAVSYASPQKMSPDEEAARKEVESARNALAQLIKLKGAVVAVGILYTDDYVMVQPDGKEITRTELLKQIADGKQFQSTADQENELKAEGGKTVALPKNKQKWRPDRYEVGDDGLIYAYTSPVQKTHQLLPFGKDGKLIDVEIKVLSTFKETYKRRLVAGKSLAFLKREESVGMKTYLNGKEQPAGFNTGDAPPKL